MPEFEEHAEGMLVTLFCRAAKKIARAQQPESQPESLAMRVLNILKKSTLSKSEISHRLGQKEISGQLNVVIRQLLKGQFLELTIPDKPGSSRQKYGLTEKGRFLLK